MTQNILWSKPLSFAHLRQYLLIIFGQANVNVALHTQTRTYTEYHLQHYRLLSFTVKVRSYRHVALSSEHAWSTIFIGGCTHIHSRNIPQTILHGTQTAWHRQLY